MGFHLPFFPLYAAETLADGRFQGWNLEERGAWITLLCYAWNDGDVPAAHSSLARMLGVENGDMARIWSAIGSRFSPALGDPGRLVCPRLEAERDRAEGISKKRADVGRKGAEARWGNGKRMPLPSVCHSPSIAEAVPTHVSENASTVTVQEQNNTPLPPAAERRDRPERWGVTHPGFEAGEHWLSAVWPSLSRSPGSIDKRQAARLGELCGRIGPHETMARMDRAAADKWWRERLTLDAFLDNPDRWAERKRPQEKAATRRAVGVNEQGEPVFAEDA